MLDLLDFRKHLFGRRGHQVFRFTGRGAGERDKNVGEGDVDLRLLFARRHQDGEQAEQQTHQGQQGGDLGGEEAFGDTARNTQLTHCLNPSAEVSADCRP